MQLRDAVRTGGRQTREKEGRLYLIPVVLINSDGGVVRIFDNAWKIFKCSKMEKNVVASIIIEIGIAPV